MQQIVNSIEIDSALNAASASVSVSLSMSSTRSWICQLVAIGW